MSPLLELVLILALIGLAIRGLEHRERMARTNADALVAAAGLYDAETVVLAIRAAACRAADPGMGMDLVERIIETVVQDLDAGVLTDPRALAVPESE
jgi:hypothetical protein